MPNTTINVSQGMQQQYVDEVDKSITVMLQINSVLRAPNIIEIGQRL